MVTSFDGLSVVLDPNEIFGKNIVTISIKLTTYSTANATAVSNSRSPDRRGNFSGSIVTPNIFFKIQCAKANIQIANTLSRAFPTESKKDFAVSCDRFLFSNAGKQSLPHSRPVYCLAYGKTGHPIRRPKCRIVQWIQ
jgi:hypothetical protein